MTPEIGPLRPEELPALSRFLAEGFGLPADAEAVATDVLRWKYLDPRPGVPGVEGPRSLVARDGGGAIVGPVGLSRTAWRVAGSDGVIPTLHMLDWLAAGGHRGVGAALMRRANALAETQYGFGGSEIGRKVIARAGYAMRPSVAVFRRVLRPSHRLREGGPPVGRIVRGLRDAARLVLDRPARAEPVGLRAVERFGVEVEEVVARCEPPRVFTDRGPGALNALLAYPRGGPRGYRC